MSSLIDEQQRLANLVKEAREAADLTQEELASLASISRRPIYLLEGGKGAVRVDTLIKILDVFGLELVVQPRGVVSD